MNGRRRIPRLPSAGRKSGGGTPILLIAAIACLALPVGARADLTVTGSAAPSFAENGTAAVGTYSVTGGTGVTWSLSGTDIDDLSIDSSTGELTFDSPPDYENAADADTNNTYLVTVEADDGTDTGTLAVTVTVTDVASAAPVFVGYGTTADFTYEENGTAAVQAFTVTTQDSSDSVYVHISTGDDDDDFVGVWSNGTFTLAFDRQPNYEDPHDEDTDNEYEVNLQAVAVGSTILVSSLVIDVTVTDVEEDPLFGGDTGGFVTEDDSTTTVSGTLTVNDDDDTTIIAQSNTAGTYGSFSITSTGAWTYTLDNTDPSTNALDVGEDVTESFTVYASDGTSQDVVITISGYDDAPAVTGPTAPLYAENGTDPVAIYSAIDPEGHSFQWAFLGDDTTRFSYSRIANTPDIELNFVSTDRPDYETPADTNSDNAYELALLPYASGTRTGYPYYVTVSVTDVNEAPTFDEGSSTTRSIDENSPPGTPVGNAVTATDPDTNTAYSSLAYSLSGTDASSFDIHATTGQISVANGATLDWESKTSYSVTVEVSDRRHAGGAPDSTIDDTIAVTINVNDASINLAVNTTSVAEDDGATTVTVTATLDGGAIGSATTVSVSVAGSGTNTAVDFAAVTTFNINIPANVSSATGTFTLTPTDDTVDETDETVTVTGIAGTLTVASATLSLTDDETTPTVTLALDDNSVSENGGQATVTASLSGASSAVTTVTVSAAAVPPAVAADLTLTGTTLTIAAGDTSSTGLVTITGVDNNVAASNKTVNVSASVSGGNGVAAPAGTTLTLEDDDAAGITLSVSQASVAEDADPTDVTVTATVTDGNTLAAAQSVTVAVGTAGDAASEGEDYETVADFTITIEAGSTSETGTFSLDPTDDELDEGTGETLSVGGSTTGGATVTGTTVTITDNDAAPSGITLSVSPTIVIEGAGPTTVTVTATVEGGTTYATAQGVTVEVGAAGDAATEGTDYAAVDDFTVTIPAGSTSDTGTFSLDATDDELDEGNGETLSVSGTLSGVTVTPAAVTITDEAPSPPAAPTNLTATAGNAQVTLAWEDPGDSSITGYRYLQSTDGGMTFGTGTTITGSGANTTSYVVDQVTSGTAYTFKVQAQNPGGWSASSNEATATPQQPPPGAPTNFIATAGNAQVTLAWANPNDSNITAYRYRQSTDGGTTFGTFTTITGSGANTTSHVVDQLTNGAAYTFEIQAQNTGGWSDLSTQATATPIAPPVVPTNLAATAGNGIVILGWADPRDSSITAYRYRQSTDGGATFGAFTTISGSGANTTSHVVDQLTSGTAYTFEIQAKNAGGWSGSSNRATATPIAPPGAPTNFIATASNAQVTLAWANPNDSNITAYRYRQSTDGGATFGTFTTIAGSGASTTSHVVDQLTNGTAYTFEIQAQNAGGWSTSSIQATATPMVPAGTPTGLTATAGNGIVTLGWANPSDPSILRYRYRQSTDGGATFGAFVTIAGSGANTTSHIVTGLTNGSTYTFEIQAQRSFGWSPSSNRASAALLTAPPVAPTVLTATAGNGIVTLEWENPNDTNITAYRYRQSTDGGATFGAFVTIAGSGASTTSHVVGQLTNGTAYTFEIQAQNTVGWSASSNQDTATPIEPLGAPTSLTATAGNAQVTLGWANPNDTSITAYRYRQSTNGGVSFGVFATIAGSGANTTSHVVIQLTNGTAYTFEIQAQRSAVWSASSNQAAATPIAPPDSPLNLTATAGNGTAILGWAEPDDASITAYRYRQSTDGGTTFGAFTTIAGSSASTTSHIVSQLTNGTAYTFEIQAQRSSDWSASSNQATATPFAPPAAPTSFTATTGNGQVTLDWAEPYDSSITAYRYRQSTDGGTTFGAFTTITGSGANTTSHVVAQLTNGTAYTFEIQAQNASGWSASSNRAAATPIVPTATPTGLTATAGNAQVTLGWADPNDSSITAYRYRQSTNGGVSFGAFVTIAGSGAATTSHVVSQLTNGIAYTFEIQAQRSSGWSASSNQATATPFAPPDAPTSFTATAGDGRVTLGWAEPYDRSSITAYRYRQSTDGGTTFGAFRTITGSGASTTSHTVSQLTNGTEYTFEVQAQNASGWSVSSSQATVAPQIASPAAPAGLNATAGNAQVTLAWVDPSDSGITAYRYRQSTDGGTFGDFTTIAGSGASTKSHVVGQLTNGTAYTFEIQAQNAGGWSASSNQTTVTPQIQPPGAATGLTATAGNGQVTLGWVNPSGSGMTASRYRKSTDGGLTFGAFTTITGSGASHVVDQLTNNTSYTFVVQAGNAGGWSTSSNEATATPIQPLVASFAASSYRTTEGGTAAAVTVSLDQTSDRALTIPITTDPTSGDFSLSSTSLTFASGDQSKTFTVTASEDADLDDDTVELGFGTLPTAVTAGNQATATVALEDDDGAALQVSFGASTYTAIENGAAVTVTVSLDATSDRALTIPITTDPATGDFSLSADSLSFAVGDQSKTFTVTASEDADLDDDTVTLSFGTLPTGVTAGSQATVALEDDDGAALQVSFGASTYTAIENGAAVTVTVSLDATSDRALTIPITTDPATGDFSLSADSLSFASGDQSKTFTVTASEDADLDDDTVELGFGTLPTAVTAGSQAAATVALEDDDGAALQVSFGASTYTAIENGAAVTVTVSLDATSDRALTIPITTDPATGDFSLSADSLSFAVGDQSKTFTVTASEDADLDDDTVTLSFGTLPTAVTAGSQATATVALEDDDGAALQVSFGASTYTAIENGAAVTVTVSLDATSDRALTIPITTDPATGDFSLSADSLSFAVGDQSKTFTVTASEDADLDDDTVTLSFGTLPTGVTAGSQAAATVALEDDDGAALQVSFGASTYTAIEGEAAVTVTVSLDATSDRALTIPITTDPATGDFSLSADSLSFAVGDQSKTFTVTASEDADLDDDTVTLSFGTLPTGVTAGSQAAATVALEDDDGAALQVSFGASTYTAIEGEAAVTVTVSLDATSDRALTIPITTDPTSGDFSLSSTSLTFASGDQSKTFTVTASEDADLDDDTVELGFGTLPTAVTAGNQATVTVALEDDDGAALQVSFGASTYTAIENGAAVTVTVSLDATSDRALTIPITTDPTSGDFSLSSTSLTFASGDQSKTFTVTASEDADLDDDTVELGFGTLPTAVTAGNQATATVALEDDDGAALQVTFGASTYTAIENGAAVTVTVSLDATSDRALTIPITTDPTSGDFSLSSTSLTFASGDQSKTFTVTASEDADLDDDTVELGFGTLPTAVTAGNQAAATVALEDDDGAALQVSFGASTYTAIENGAAVTVTVSLDATSDRALTIPITTDPTSGDFSLSATSLTFASGDQSKAFTVTASEDADLDDETVTLSFGTLPTGVTAGTPSSAAVTLEDDDDDAEALTVTFGKSTYTAIENGAAASVTVGLDKMSDRALTIPISLSPSTGDFSASSTSLSFAAGDQTKTITVTASEDADLDDETVTLSFGTLPTGVTAGTPSSAAVTLEDDDDDAEALTVTFGKSTYTAIENGAAASVTVGLDKMSDRALTIPISLSPSTGDFSASSTSLSFAAGDQTKTITVTASEDADLDDETVTLSFGTLPTGVTAGTPSSAAVTLEDDDDDAEALTVTFGASTYTAIENGAAAAVTVGLDKMSDRALTIPITLSPSTGDFSASSTSLSFAAGDRTKTITVTASEDADLADETVTLSFGTLPTGVTAGTPSSAAVTLEDDDDAAEALTVTFGKSTYTAIENGAAASVTVGLDKMADRALTIPITLSPSTGDFSASSTSLSFAAGDQTKTITVTASEDADLDDETVTLSFGTLPTGVTAGTPSSAAVTLEDDDDAAEALTVTFGKSTYTAIENGTAAAVTVGLDKMADRALTIPITLSPSTGDFSASSTSLSFAAGDQTKTITVTASEDTDLDDETVTLSFGTLPTGVTAGTPSSAAVTLEDDDDAAEALTVTFGASTYTAIENGAAVTVTVSLDATSDRALTIPISLSPSTGDFSASSTSLSFAAGDQTKTITVTASEDADLDDETVTLSFGTLPTGVTAGTPSSAAVTLEDDDDAAEALTVTFGASTYTAIENGAAVTVTVGLDKMADRALTIPITLSPSTGDFSASSTSLSFAAGDQTKTITVTASEDADLDDETVTLSFGTLPTGVTAGTPSSAAVTLEDDDDDAEALTVTFAASTYTAIENGAAASVTVGLDKMADRALTIPITLSPSTGDFSASSTSLSFAAGDQTKTITVTASEDTDLDDETVTLSFGTLPTGVTAGTPSSAAVTLEDDDDAAEALTVTFGASTYTAIENGAAVTVTVSLDATSDRALTIPISLSPSTGDFSASSTSLSFAAGDQTKTITVTASEDADLDDETVTLSFGTLPTGVTAGTPSSAAVTLEDDDDDAEALTVTFAASTYTAIENGAAASVTVGLDKMADRALTIPITLSPSTGDFSASSTSLSFAAGDQTKTITVTASEDADLDDETVTLSFGTLPTGVTAGTPSSAAVTLEDDDDDAEALTVTFAASTYTAIENGAAASVTVGLDKMADRALTIPISLSPSTGDFSASSTSLSFAAGDQTKTITVTASEDADLDDETVTLSFGTLPTGVTAGTPSSAAVTLEDDDDAAEALTVTFGKSTYTAIENGTAAAVTVGLDKMADRALTIPISLSPSTGDFSASSTSLSFAAGDQTKTITVTASEDADLDDETVTLSFGTLPTGVTAGTPSSAAVTLEDDDDAAEALTVTFGKSTYTAIENGTAAAVTVGLDKMADRALTIPITLSPSTGDFSASSTSLSFAAGDQTKTITVTASEDADLDDETVTLSFGTLPTGVTAGTPSSAAVTLEDDDDDAEALTVTFGKSTYTAIENGTAAAVTVSLDATSDRALTIPISLSPSTGDFSASSTSLSFAAGDQTKTITVTASEDADLDDETVTLSFGTLPTGVTAGTPSSAAVTLEDDDDAAEALTVTFGKSTYTAIENGTAAAVTVGLDKMADRALTIPISLSPSTGDFSASSTSLSFAAGDQTKTITVTASEDADLDDETVTLSFGTLPTGVTAGTPSSAAVTLEDDDDDAEALTVTFGKSTYTAIENGAAASVTVGLDKMSDRALTIPISLSPSTGDFSASSTSLSFAAGDQTKTITVTASEDADLDDETVTLSFGTLPTGVTAGTPSSAAVTLEDDDDDAEALTVTFGASTYTAIENGAAAAVTVGLDKMSDRALTIPITLSPSTGDFSASSTSLSFAAGDRTKTITVTASEDADLADETVTLSFGTLPTGVTAGTPSSAAVTLEDDDDAAEALTVTFGKSTYTAIENGAAASVTVGLDKMADRALTIPITLSPSTGDFSASSTSLSFAAGDQTKTITVTASEDADLDDETVTLSFGTLPTGVTAGTPSSAAVTLEDDDDDAEALTVTFGKSTYTAIENGTAAAVTVGLDKMADRALTIPITLSPSTGDFSASSTSLSFAAGDQTKTITVTASEDTDLDDETVTLSFGTLPTGVTAGTPSSAAVTLEDDDDAAEALTVTFGASTYTAIENGAAVTVTVSLDATSDRALTIPISLSPSTGDFSASSTSLSFAAGDQTKTITVTASEDADLDDETVTLSFGTLPTGVTAGTPSSAAVTLEDDDDAAEALTVTFGASTYTAIENGAAVTVTVGLDKMADRALTIPITLSPSTGDFSASSTSLSFAAGDQTKTITVTASEDADLDDETVTLSFGTLPTGVTAGTPSSAAVTLEDDDDDAEALTVTFAASTYTAIENGAAASVTVGLDKMADRALTIPITLSPSTGDFSASSTSLSFAAGDQTKTITVTASEDTDLDDETVTLSFGTLPTGVTAGTPSSAAVTLEDDDDAAEALTVTFGASTYTAIENGAAVTVTVSLDATSDRALTIPISLSPSTGDFSASSTSLSFAAGDQTKTITVTASEDADLDDETVTLSFGTLPTGVTAGTPSSAAVTLEDDDDAAEALTVTFGASTYTAIENGAAVTVTVGLDKMADRALTIPITLSPSTGDFSASSTSLSFAAGDQTKTITVTASEDADLDDETVTLSFGTLPTGVTAGTPSSAAVTLEDDDDDAEALTVTFAASTYTAIENGAAASVTVGLDKMADRALTIPISLSPSTGDFSASSTSLSFAAGDQTKTITVTASEDADLDDETVTLSFGTLPTGVTAGTPSSAAVTLEDDDDAATSLTATFGASTYTAIEGERGVSVTVSVDQAADRALTIPITTDPSSGDFTGPAEVVFAVGDDSKTITVTATDDPDLDDETVRLSFGALPTNVSAGSRAATTVTLVDDDRAELTVTLGAGGTEGGTTYTATEGGTGAQVPVSLGQSADRSIVIPITTDPASGDFTLSATSLSFAVGDETKTITVTATDDPDLEDETVTLGLGALPVDVSAGSQATTTVTLVDDDRTPLTVTFAAETYTAKENGTEAEVRVALDQAADREVRIPITTDPASGDFTGPAEVVFAVGDDSKTITVTATDDPDLDDETVRLSFGTLPVDVSEGGQATTTVTLVDDDRTPLTVTFAAETYTAKENGTEAEVRVVLDQAADREVRISITADPATGDFALSATQVVFAVGDESKTVTVTASEDPDLDDERVTLGFGTLPVDVSAGSPSATTVTLVDDDEVPLVVSFGAASYEATEGGPAATVTVALDQAADREVTIPLTTDPETGDFALSATQVVFAVDDATKTITVTASEDPDRDDETVELGFGTLPVDVSAGSPSATTVTLVDKTLLELEVSFVQADYQMREGVEALIEVQVSPAADRRVEVPLEVTPEGGASEADYRMPVSVVIEEGESQGTVTMEVHADEVNDPGESVVVGLAGMPEAVSAGDLSATQVHFRQWRTTEQFSQTLEAIAAVIARTMGDSAQTAIEGRFERHRQRSRSGQSVDTMPTLQPGSVALSDQTHISPSPGSVIAPSRRVYGQQNRLHGSGAGAGPLGPGSRGFSGVRDHLFSLSGVSFEMSSGAFETSLGESEKETNWVPVLWGQGNLHHFSGDLKRMGMNYRGGLEAAHVGLDLFADDQVLAGLSFMRSRGHLDYTDDGIDAVLLESRMNTVHPYLHWQPNERLSVWGIGGLGWGQVDATEPGRAHDFDADFLMFAGGVRAVLGGRANNEWGLRADAFTAQLQTDASKDIAKVSGEAHRGRLMLEWVHDRELSVGRSLSLTAEAGGRFDGGDADRGSGVETGLRLGFLDANSGLDVALHGRVLVAHESDYRDWGAGVQASWDPGAKRRGLTLSVNSSLGQDGGGGTTLWDNADAITRTAGLGALGTGSQYRMESEVAYAGIRAPGLRGLLTPYSRLRWAGQARELALGTTWSLPTRSHAAMPATFELECLRRESTTGPADLAVLLRVSIPMGASQRVIPRPGRDFTVALQLTPPRDAAPALESTPPGLARSPTETARSGGEGRGVTIQAALLRSARAMPQPSSAAPPTEIAELQALTTPPPEPRRQPQPAEPVPELSPSGDILVQVGAFRSGEKAARLTHELRQEGYAANTIEGSDYDRVVVGPFASRTEAANARSQLDQQGYEGYLRADLAHRLPPTR